MRSPFQIGFWDDEIPKSSLLFQFGNQNQNNRYRNKSRDSNNHRNHFDMNDENKFVQLDSEKEIVSIVIDFTFIVLSI